MLAHNKVEADGGEEKGWHHNDGHPIVPHTDDAEACGNDAGHEAEYELRHRAVLLLQKDSTD